MSAPEMHGTLHVEFDSKKVKLADVEAKVVKALRGNTVLANDDDAFGKWVKFEYVDDKPCVEFEEWTSWEFEEFFNELRLDVDRTGKKIWFDGTICAYGDYDSFYDVLHNKVKEHEMTSYDLVYASDRELIAILEERGYKVTKAKKPNKKGKTKNEKKRSS